MYLRDKIGNGGGTSGGVAITGAVNKFADLPDASTHLGQYFIVNTSTGLWIVNRKEKGIYRAIGPGSTDWERLGAWVEAFSSANFEVYDSVTSTNAMTIDTSALSGKRAVKIPNENGTIAYATGLTGGQTLNGGKAASNNLTLDSTQHATKGSILCNSNLKFNSAYDYQIAGGRYAFRNDTFLNIGLFFNGSPPQFEFIQVNGIATVKINASGVSQSYFKVCDNAAVERHVLSGDGKYTITTPTASAFMNYNGSVGVGSGNNISTDGTYLDANENLKIETPSGTRYLKTYTRT